MKSIHLITVGKLKDKNLEAIEADYLKRIKNPDIKIHEVKASAENADAEGKAVLKKVQSIDPNGKIILMTEFGKEYDSIAFSKFVTKLSEDPSCIFFVICGAEGPSTELKTESYKQLSLSKLTYPHKLARVILIEQLYRAQTIRTAHPYHN